MIATQPLEHDSMRAVAFASFGGPEVLQILDVPTPVPGPGQIRIAVRGCGVNPFDWKQRRGQFGGTPPIRVGVEVAGIVDAIGDDEPGDVAVGDRVYGFAMGGGASELALSEHYAPIPASLDFVSAAGMPVAVETAYRLLDGFGPLSDATLLINGGSGAVGQSIVQIAVARGATVIATASAANQSLLRELGSRPLTYGAGLPERVNALGVGTVDVAIDASGGALADLVALTGDPQRVVTIVPDPAVAALGVRISGGNSAFHGLRDIAELLARGDYRPPATHSYALTDVSAAQERSETGHPGGVKLVLVP